MGAIGVLAPLLGHYVGKGALTLPFLLVKSVLAFDLFLLSKCRRCRAARSSHFAISSATGPVQVSSSRIVVETA
jgi:hypothetical protein